MFTELSTRDLLDIYGRTYNDGENKSCLEECYLKFQDAKKLNSYKYSEDEKLSNIKKEYEKYLNGEDSSFIRTFYAPIRLRVSNLAIELTIIPSLKEGVNPPQFSYVIWEKNTKRWKILEIILEKVNLDIDDNLIEKFMFNKLIEFYNKNNLCWK